LHKSAIFSSILLLNYFCTFVNYIIFSCQHLFVYALLPHVWFFFKLPNMNHSTLLHTHVINF
jgi:hypothetical protein